METRFLGGDEMNVKEEIISDRKRIKTNSA
jgi:hypothetical protein